MNPKLVKAMERISGPYSAVPVVSSALFFLALGILIMFESHQAGNSRAFPLGLLTALTLPALTALTGISIHLEKGTPDSTTSG